MNGENKRRFMGEDLLKQFRFSLMSPTEFSDEVSLVMPKDILFLTEVVDVFKRFTSVSIPGGFKFSLSPRKTADEPLSSFNTGEVQVLIRRPVGPRLMCRIRQECSHLQ